MYLYLLSLEQSLLYHFSFTWLLYNEDYVFRVCDMYAVCAVDSHVANVDVPVNPNVVVVRGIRRLDAVRFLDIGCSIAVFNDFEI